MKGYVLSVDADADIEGIWDCGADWIGKLFEAFEMLADMPRMGHRRDDLTSYPVLFWSVGAYLIIYRAVISPLFSAAASIEFTPWPLH